MTSSIFDFSKAGDETTWNFDNVDAALPTLFASLFVNDGERMFLGVTTGEMDGFCDGVLGSFPVLFPVVLLLRFRFFII